MTARFVKFLDIGFLAPAHLWVYPSGRSLDDVSGTLSDPGRPAKRVGDLKEWMLGAGQPSKKIDIDGTSSQFRKIDRRRALEIYFRQLFEKASPKIDASTELWFLLPAFSDDVARSDYRLLLRAAADAALPGATVRFLFEPDMALEYFRVVRKELSLRRDRNDIFLVVDCGAATCNLTIVISTRDKQISGAQFGRAGVLNSRPGESILRAGRFVDRGLVGRLFGQSPIDGSSPMFVAVEAAKIRCSDTNLPAYITDPSGRTVSITPQELADESDRLWAFYEPHLKVLLDETYEQISEHARDQFDENGVTDGRTLGRNLSGIVLAGGTSQLPGFEAALRGVLDVTDEVPTFRVGAEYPIVAAFGALAHLLEQKKLKIDAYPSDLEDNPDADEVHAAKFVPALQDDIYLFRDGVGAEEKLVDRTRWPFGYHESQKVGAPRKWDGKQVRIAPCVGQSSAGVLRGSHSQYSGWVVFRNDSPANPMTVQAGADGAELVLGVRKDGAKQNQHYYFPLDGEIHDSVDGARGSSKDDGRRECAFAVVDFGMSKSVIAHCDGFLGPLPELPIARQSNGLPFVPLGWRVGSHELVMPPPPAAAIKRAPNENVVSRRLYGKDDEREFLKDSLDVVPESVALDLLGLHLAAKSPSPLTLLVGPPGAGKTSLVRTYAALLGCTADRSDFLWVPVQSDWVSHQEFLSATEKAWKVVRDEPDYMSVLLLDEFNLARPEYYLGDVLAQFEGASLDRDAHIVPRDADGFPRAIMFGTLNVDECSRPPSDKITDRSFLFEVSSPVFEGVVRPGRIPVATGQVPYSSWRAWCGAATELPIPGEVQDLIGRLRDIENRVRRSPHEVFTPSWRGVRDVAYFMHEFERLKLAELNPAFSREYVLDLVVCGRMLPRLRGPSGVMEEALQQLQTFFLGAGIRWNRSADRIASMMRQVEDGVVSFWG